MGELQIFRAESAQDRIHSCKAVGAGEKPDSYTIAMVGMGLLPVRTRGRSHPIQSSFSNRFRDRPRATAVSDGANVWVNSKPYVNCAIFDFCVCVCVWHRT